jgi:hypothetical protein
MSTSWGRSVNDTGMVHVQVRHALLIVAPGAHTPMHKSWYRERATHAVARGGAHVNLCTVCTQCPYIAHRVVYVHSCVTAPTMDYASKYCLCTNTPLHALHDALCENVHFNRRGVRSQLQSFINTPILK